MNRKNDLKALALAMMMLSMGTASFAQDAQRGGNRPSREQMIEMQATNIAKNLKLD